MNGRRRWVDLVLTGARWHGLALLIDEVRPCCRARHTDLRRTVEAITWRHQNGAKWRSIPAEFGP